MLEPAAHACRPSAPVAGVIAFTKSSIALATGRPITGCWRFRNFKGAKTFDSSRTISLTAMTHPLTGPDARSNPGVDIAFACFTRAPVPERYDAPCPKPIATCFPRDEERLLKGVLGCAIPEFIARFGTADAIKSNPNCGATARALARTLRVLERRPRADRDARKREFNPKAS